MNIKSTETIGYIDGDKPIYYNRPNHMIMIPHLNLIRTGTTHIESAVRWVRKNIKAYKECDKYNYVK